MSSLIVILCNMIRNTQEINDYEASISCKYMIFRHYGILQVSSVFTKPFMIDFHTHQNDDHSIRDINIWSQPKNLPNHEDYDVIIS